MKPNSRILFASALVALALCAGGAYSQTVTNITPRPAAMQPGGDAADTTCNFGLWWTGNGSVTEDLDTTVHSLDNIAGSLHVVYDCPGGTVTPVASANLAFGNFLSAKWGNNTWLGAGDSFDAAKYQSCPRPQA